MVSFEGSRHKPYWPWWRIMLLVMNVLALVLSIILSWHYLKGGSMLGCGGGSPCDQVLNSRWSTIAGVLPVSSLATGVYLAMLVASLFIGGGTNTEIRGLVWNVLLILAGSIAGGAIWFIIVQKWVIGYFCPYCITIHTAGLLCAALIIRQALAHPDSIFSLSNNSTKPQNVSTATKQPVVPLHLVGFIFIGLLLSGIMAASQILFTPKAAYYSGESQDNLTDINYHAAPIIGSPDAPYVVKLLFDYQCPHCQKIHFMLHEAVRRYAGKLSFILCPTPLNTQCNPYIPRDVDAFKNSCEMARIGLAVWAAKPESFTSFENWMFTFESGDRWQPRPVEAARAKAVELVGKEKFNDAVREPWIEQYMQSCIQTYGETMQGGRGGIPKLVFGSQWVIPEPNNEEDLIMILQKSLRIPKP
jgi:uncharacterized membrane protein/protein-disulfide isomerase